VRVPLRRSMVVLMGAAIISIVGSEWETVVRDLQTSAGAALILVSAMLAAAYLLARLFRIEERDAFTISIEVGLQNGALATMIVVTLLGRPDLMVFPGTYAVLSFIPVSVWTFAMRRRFEA
jgi:BASS family bile acid:Na+ symporter